VEQNRKAIEMKRRTAAKTMAGSTRKAEKESKANQLLGSFKDFAKIKAGKDDYRDQADEALEASQMFDELPLPQDWESLANAMWDAGVFDEIADNHKGDDIFFLSLDLRPKVANNGEPVLGLLFWLYVNQFTNEDGTKACNAALGDGEPITPRQAASYYIASNVYRNGEPTLQEMDAKARNARHAVVRRERAEKARQGCNPTKTATAQVNDQTTPEAIDNENVIGAIATRFDAELDKAVELLNADKKQQAGKTLDTAYINARAEMIEAGRQGDARETTVATFIENIGEMIAEFKAS